MVKALNRSN